MNALARHVMNKADQMSRNKSITATELETYLAGSPFHDFAAWMMLPQDGSKVLKHFNTYDKLGNNDGGLGMFELTKALWDYVEVRPRPGWLQP